MRYSNIAVFIPHLGCPHRCSFCDQNSISGAGNAPSPAEVQTILQDAVPKLKEPSRSEIAFFGGSFTAVEPEYRRQLLEIASAYVKEYGLYGVRVSTRPDAIDKVILNELKEYSVRVIELGAQSLSDRVLTLNRRGHTAEDVRSASALIRGKGFQLGLQMMTGLYGSTEEDDRKAAAEFINLKADMVRIYPTVTLKGTYLEKLYREGRYKPQSLEQAVLECTGLYRMFLDAGIPVIRLGLHASPELERQAVCGPYHPAFRELCESRIMLENARELLKGFPAGAVTLGVSGKSISKMSGQHRENLKRLQKDGYTVRLVSDPSLEKYQIKLLEGETVCF
jgi:histone acetyltransferase (RNA polymerase elongator complex component)